VQGGWTDSEQFMAAGLLGEPHVVAGGAGYAQDGYYINTIQGQVGGGRSSGKGRSWENEGQIVENAYDDEQEVAAALLLAIKNDQYHCEV
jgi:hypothetical protein